MTEQLRDEVAEAVWNAIDSRSGDPVGVVIHMSDHLFPREGEGEIDAAKGVCRDIAEAVVEVVLVRIERHLSAVQYDRAPYSALMHRLGTLREQSGGGNV